MKKFNKVTCAQEGCKVELLVTEGSDVKFCSTHQPVGVEDTSTVAENLRNHVGASLNAGKLFLDSIFGGSAVGETPVAEETKTNKESVNMKEQFKSVAGAAVKVAKEASAKVYAFIKRHAVKAVAGLGAVTVAGTFTTGMGPAVVAGSLIYAAVAVAASLIQAKRKKAEADKVEIVLNALGQGFTYGISSMVLCIAAGFAVGLLANVFVYSYVGYAYMTYFIVA